MSGSKLGDKLEELDLSPEEIHRLTEAMKKKEFRDLLAEYAKEIQDPENKVTFRQLLFYLIDVSRTRKTSQKATRQKCYRQNSRRKLE